MPSMTVMIFEDDEDGGVEVEFEFTVAGADPDVGIMTEYVEEWWISGTDEESKKLIERLNADPKEDERVGQYIQDRYEPGDYYDDYDPRDYD